MRVERGSGKSSTWKKIQEKDTKKKRNFEGRDVRIKKYSMHHSAVEKFQSESKCKTNS